MSVDALHASCIEVGIRFHAFSCKYCKVITFHTHTVSSPVTMGAIYTTCLSKAILYPHNLELSHLTLVQSTRQAYVTVLQALDPTTSV